MLKNSKHICTSLNTFTCTLNTSALAKTQVAQRYQPFSFTKHIYAHRMQNGRLSPQKLNTMKALLSLLKHTGLKIEDTCQLSDNIYMDQFRITLSLPEHNDSKLKTHANDEQTYIGQFRMQFAEGAKN